jgi:hypothetical protein
MKILKESLVFLLVILIMMLMFACDNEPVPGKITAIASGITGQDGKILAVGAFDFDWSPGISDPGFAGYRTEITGDSFSSSEVLLTLDDQGRTTANDALLDPGTYSVVFVVSAVNTPPEYYVEVRVRVDGDMNATAPAWADWKNMQQ